MYEIGKTVGKSFQKDTVEASTTFSQPTKRKKRKVIPAGKIQPEMRIEVEDFLGTNSKITLLGEKLRTTHQDLWKAALEGGGDGKRSAVMVWVMLKHICVIP